MANRRKHMERSHRSHKNKRPFAYFESSGMKIKQQKASRNAVLELIKSFFHRNKNK